MSRQISEFELARRVRKWLPKGIPAEAIEDVECDPYDSVRVDGSYSYWVHLAPGYIAPGLGCHTIHEDTLAEVKYEVQHIYVDYKELAESM